MLGEAGAAILSGWDAQDEVPFGVEELFACAHSLQQRGLDGSTLELPVQVLDDAALRALIARFDQVVTL